MSRQKNRHQFDIYDNLNMPTPWSLYRHYKSTGWNDHVYEIIGTAKHSETDEILVVYKPLYECSWQEWCDFTARPLSMWEEMVEWNGEMVPRFTLITEQSVSNDS